LEKLLKWQSNDQAHGSPLQDLKQDLKHKSQANEDKAKTSTQRKRGG